MSEYHEEEVIKDENEQVFEYKWVRQPRLKGSDCILGRVSNLIVHY